MNRMYEMLSNIVKYRSERTGQIAANLEGPTLAGYGLTLRFEVTIDHKVDLGNWTKCEGLTVEWELQEYREGGLNDYVHRLPGRRKFQNIKLTRPIDETPEGRRS